LYNESEGRVLTDLMSFDINDGVDPSNKGPQLLFLLRVPKAFASQVLKAASSAHGLTSLDNCRLLLCSAFQKVLEREALLQHIHIKQGVGMAYRLRDLCFAFTVESSLHCSQVRPRMRILCALAVCLPWSL
jgi:hypothetical protein